MEKLAKKKAKLKAAEGRENCSTWLHVQIRTPKLYRRLLRMTLQSIHGDPISGVPHLKFFNSYCTHLGDERLEAVRAGLRSLIDEMSPDPRTGYRTFSSSFLGSELSPWPYPIGHLYDAAREMSGKATTEQEVQDQAGLIFGLFVWECVINRDELWAVYDPNLSNRDPNREITGKVYFELG